MLVFQWWHTGINFFFHDSFIQMIPRIIFLSIYHFQMLRMKQWEGFVTSCNFSFSRSSVYKKSTYFYAALLTFTWRAYGCMALSTSNRTVLGTSRSSLSSQAACRQSGPKANYSRVCMCVRGWCTCVWDMSLTYISWLSLKNFSKFFTIFCLFFYS